MQVDAAPSTARSSSDATVSDRDASSDATSVSTSTRPAEMQHLLRLRTALDFLLANYVPSQVSLSLRTLLSTSISAPIDFKPLEGHLDQLDSLRRQAIAARSLSDYSRKRSINEDEEAGDTRAEKKRRKDEEEKRKRAGESRGLRDLKRTDVSGMKKMSDFFGAKAKVKS